MPMPLLTHPEIWLANSSNELAYQSGETPFGLSCFSQDSLQYLNELLDQLANNNEDHRADGLQYANKKDRQMAFQEMQQSLGKNYTQKAHVFVKNFTSDQALLSQEIVHVKSTIVDAMLGVLRAIVTTGDLTRDTMINTEVIPALKQLGILMPKTSELSLPGSFNAVQFAG